MLIELSGQRWLNAFGHRYMFALADELYTKRICFGVNLF